MDKLLSFPYLLYAAFVYYAFVYYGGALSIIQSEIKALTEDVINISSLPLNFNDYFSLAVSLIFVAILAVVALGIWTKMKWGYLGGLAANLLVPAYLGLAFLYESTTCEGLECIGAGMILRVLLPFVLIISVWTTWPLLNRFRQAQINYFNKFILLAVIILIILHLALVGSLQFMFVTTRGSEF